MVATNATIGEGELVNPLWDIVQAHLDRYGVRQAELSRRIGASSATLNQWKNRGVNGLPQKRLLVALSRETGVSYDVLLDAALRSIGYLPEEAGEEHDQRSAPMNDAGETPANVRPFKPVPKSSRPPRAKAAREGMDEREGEPGDDGA